MGRADAVWDNRCWLLIRSATSTVCLGVERERCPPEWVNLSDPSQPMLADFEVAARRVRYAPPTIGVVSNVTGEPIAEELASPAYWCRHLRQPVRFAYGPDLQLSTIVSSLFHSLCS